MKPKGLTFYGSRDIAPFIVSGRADTGRPDKAIPVSLIAAKPNCIAVNRAGTLLAVGMATAPYRQVVNLETDSLITVLPSMPNQGRGAAFSPDGSLLAFAHYSAPFLTVINTETWGAVTIESAPTGNGNGVCFSHDGSLLAVCHATAPYLTIYQTSDWTKVALAESISAAAQSASFSPDGTMLLVAYSASPYVVIYDTATWMKRLPALPSAGGSPYGCSFNHDASLAAVGHGGSPFFTVYDVAAGTKITPFAQMPTAACIDSRFSPDGRFLAVCMSSSGTESDGFFVYRTDTWEVVPEVIGPDGFNRGRANTGISEFMAQRRKITGSVRDLDNLPAARTVRALDRATGELLAETVSDATTGDYTLYVYADEEIEVDVQFKAAAGEQLNDLFFARTTPAVG